MRLQTNQVSVFDNKMITAMEANPTIDIEVVFMYKGMKLRVVIPRGYKVRSLLDEKGYCGYLRLADILGAQQVK